MEQRIRVAGVHYIPGQGEPSRPFLDWVDITSKETILDFFIRHVKEQYNNPIPEIKAVTTGVIYGATVITVIGEYKNADGSPPNDFQDEFTLSLGAWGDVDLSTEESLITFTFEDPSPIFNALEFSMPWDSK